MSKNVIIASVIVVVVVLVGGYFLLGSINKPEGGQNQVSNNTEQSGKKMAFLDFVKKGGSYKCEVNQLINNTQTKGTTYINNRMIRGEYNTTVQGINITSMMIVRDGFAYNWNSMMPNAGFKIKVDGNYNSSGVETSGNYSFNGETIGDYNCDAWTVDQSKFAVPTNITFQEIIN